MSLDPDETDIIIVTAGTGSPGAAVRIQDWQLKCEKELAGVVNVHQGPREPSLNWSWAGTTQHQTRHYLGTVPAFALGLGIAASLAKPGRFTLAACFHDDLEIHEDGWDTKVREAHAGEYQVLSGFFGAKGLGTDDIYKTPYNPYQLARHDCYSNLVDAESHGARFIGPSPMDVAVLDGFSQIGEVNQLHRWYGWMANQGIKHHAYDALLGILAASIGVTVKLIPVKCRHLGGQTAVGDSRYQDWALSQDPKGDQGFWDAAHKITYEAGRGILPLRVK